jgi:hypothetical protein
MMTEDFMRTIDAPDRSPVPPSRSASALNLIGRVAAAVQRAALDDSLGAIDVLPTRTTWHSSMQILPAGAASGALGRTVGAKGSQPTNNLWLDEGATREILPRDPL